MKNKFKYGGGVLTTLVFVAALSFISCANSAGSGSEENSQSDQNNQFDINYSLGDAPQSDPLPEDKYSINEEIPEGIYIEFDIPTSGKYWTTRVYIEGLGAVAESVYEYSDEGKKKGCFYYPFVEAGKEYTIRFVFLRKEEQNEEGFVIDYKGDDGTLGWFQTKVTAGAQSKGEVRFTSKGKIDVKKNGDFRFTEKPTFQNEYLLDGKWEAEIGLVEGVSWAHGAERRTNWHSMQETIPIDKLTETINLYEKCVLDERGEYSIDFICVRPILNYEHYDKTYRCQWDSFVRDIYYPPIENPDLIHGIYVEYPVVTEEVYSRCDVYIDEIGKVAEMRDESIQFLDGDKKSQAKFFYPFVEPGKKYTIRFSFKRPELEDNEGFTIPTPNDTIIEYPYTVTVGAKSKGEVQLKSKGKVDAASTKQGNFKFTEKPKFQNEQLLGDDWQIELGLMEGISWEHGDERRTKWHCNVSIPKDKLDTETNLYDYAKESDSIDCICIRPILLNYEYKGKKYSYQWDSFVHDVYYPLRNPDGIYLELDLPKNEFSRCDVTIDGIGKVAEGITPLKENPVRASFFYPFLEPNKDYTIHFSFKKPEPVDSEGFTIPISGSDTLSEVKMNVTAGARSKGEVRLPWENVGYLKADPDCNITYFQKPTFENEQRLGNDWMIEIGLMEGISWDHGNERRTKWHCAVVIPKDFDANSKNLRNLKKMSPGYEPCDHEHDIDCICVRPIMLYEYGGKTYKYQWDGYTSDVHYPLNAQEININNSDDVAKIKGTWTQSSEWDETEHFLAKVHIVWNETLVIDDTNVKRSYSCKYTKLNGTTFTKQEIIDGFCYNNLSNDLPDNCFHYETGEFYYDYELEWNPNPTMYTYKIYQIHSSVTISNDSKTITDKDERDQSLSEYFGDYYYGEDGKYIQHYQLKLFQNGRELQVLTYGTDEEGYYEWPDVYKKQ